MKTKKDVIGVVGIVLILLAFATFGSYSSLVSSGENEEIISDENVILGDQETDSYEKIISDIDDSLMKTYLNNEKIDSLVEELEVSQDDLEDLLEESASLNEKISKANEDINRIKREINNTKEDLNELRKTRIKLQNQIEGNLIENKENTNLKIWLFYLSLFISVNLFIWFEVSAYYKNKNFGYRKF